MIINNSEANAQWGDKIINDKWGDHSVLVLLKKASTTPKLDPNK